MTITVAFLHYCSLAALLNNPGSILGTRQVKSNACNHWCAFFHLPVLLSPPLPLPDTLCLLFQTGLPFEITIGHACMSPISS